MKLYVHFITYALFIGLSSINSYAQFISGGPQPGDVYKEYTINLPRNNKSWRVTDPNATFVGVPGNSPSDFLPNPVHSFTIDDFSDVERVEIVIDVWGGHVGTTGKKIRFNGSQWISIPEINTTSTSGQCYTQQVTYVLDVPVNHLANGTNSIQGTSGGQTCYNFNWGQWGWYGSKVRVYYSTSKGETTGQIISHTSGTSFSDNPNIQISPDGTVDQVDFLAKYEDYDVDGDGYYNEWVEDYQRRSWNDPIEINGHIGTVSNAPYALTWDTEWVPDQSTGAISLIARIKNDQGYWYVTDVVSNLSLIRSGYSVQLYKPQNVPERFWVRNGQSDNCTINIPTLLDANEAKIHIRTWNGNENNSSFYTRVNSTNLSPYGKDHYFSYDVLDLSMSSLNAGNNTITFQSSTPDHGIEVLWPGPAIMVKYGSINSGSNPIITLQPQNQTIGIGQAASFSVAATSDSPLSYQWMKNGIDISGANQATLNLPSITPIENGSMYSCKVTNSSGTTLSSSATLAIIDTGVRITNDVDEGIDCYKIETESAIYYFDKSGGGFVSMIDKDGIDWISHNPTPGSESAGEYRGFPNTGELHPGYTGGSSSTISPTNVWQDSVVVQTSRNGEQATFIFYPSHAKMILGAIGGSDSAYWILFEGTPGGAVGADDRIYLSNGTNFDANQDHPFGSNDIANTSGNALGSEWMYITDGIQNRSLFLAITDDDVQDNYWQMQDNMTVFGSGREQGSVIQYRTDINAEAIIGFVESKESVIVESSINNAWNLNSLGEIPLPPSNLLVSEVSQGVELNWVDNANNETGFEIERKENGGAFVLLTTLGPNISSFIDLSVEQSNTYEYRIRALNGSGYSVYSNVVSITTNNGNSSESLVLHLPFNGNANDISSNGNDGIINGPQLTTDKDNAAEMAYSFDGANDFIEVPDSPELNVDQITMTGWIYTDSYKDDQRIISKETGTVKPWSAYTLLLSGTGERQLEFRIGIGGERFRLASTTDIPLNQWVHVAGTYDGTNMRLYINGQLNNTLAASGPIQDTPNPIYVGGSQFWPRYFDGKIDEVRIYDASLDALEIEDIYNNVSPGPTIPQTPTTLAVQELSQGVVGLSWTDNSDNEDGFIIERQEDGGGYVLLDSIGADETSYNDSTVTAGINYDYHVMASNAAGRSTESNIATIIIEIQVTVPDAPTTLNATELSQTVIGLTWTDNSDNEEGFIIERQEDGGGYVLLDSIGADETSYNDSTVTAGINYDYRVMASNSAGRSTESNIATIIIEIPVTVPNPPTTLNATELSQTVIGLTWTDNSDNEEGFIIERQEDGGGYVLLDSIGVDETSYNDSTVTAGINYNYRVLASNAAGRSTESNIATIIIEIPVTVPNPPTTLNATELSQTVIGLTWTDNSDNEVGFIIERQEDGGGYAELDSIGVDETSYNDSTVTAGINYDYRLKATNVVGSSLESNIASIYILPLPNPPTGLIAQLVADSVVNLSWTDNSLLEAGFRIERQENGAGYVLLDSVAIDETSLADSTVMAGITYEYRVRSFNASGVSAPSNEETIYIDIPLTVPEAPTNLQATILSSTVISLGWTDNSDNEERFIIERQENGGGYFVLDSVGIDETSYNDSTVIAGINYDYRVIATNSAGQSTPGNVATGYIPTVPLAPASLTSTELNQTTVLLSWTDNSDDEEEFEIERSENGGSFSLLTTIGADTSTYQDMTVGPAMSYAYRVRAINSTGASTYSDTTNITMSGPPSNLVLDLRFSGDAVDWSSYNNDGIINGPQLTTDKDNAAEMAYSFDGANDFIEVPDSPELNVDQITMTGWIYTDSYKDDQRIISKETGTVKPWSAYTLLLSGTGERQLEFRIGIGGERFRLASTTDIPLNQWVHVAGTYDGTNMRLYINGQLNNTLAASGPIQDTPNPIYVGGSQFWPRYFDGKIDEVRIYDASLDALEIEDIYNNVSPGPTIPQTPTTLAVQELSQGVVGLSWTDNSDNEDGFIIERQEDGGGYVLLDSIGADETSYNDSTVTAGINYDYHVMASNAAGRSTESNVATIQLTFTDGPAITLWYGDTLVIGQNGNPQKWVNILGNVMDNGTIDSFYYQLNGGSMINVNIGPDDRRLANNGDFNIDIDVNNLINGINGVSLVAIDNEENLNTKNITISYTSGNVWSLNTTLDWQSAEAIEKEAQIVDGKWQLTTEGVRPIEMAYDRLIAIGDTSWTDYEVVVPIEIHALDSDIGVNGGNEYGIGLLMRWLGHTDSPVSGWRPKSGWEPYGEIGWFNWDKNTQANSRISFLNAGITQSMPILFDQKYIFRFRVETLPNGLHEYRLKVWLESNNEPTNWNLIHAAGSTELEKGSFMLIAHHVDATFGNVQVTALQPTIPNTPSELIATQTGNSEVELSWIDNSNNEEGFIVERSIDDSEFFVLDTLAANLTSFVDSVLVLGANRNYRILAFNSNGPSIYSDTITIYVDPPANIPNPPTNLVVSEISKSIVQLSWTDNSGDEDGFYVERRENSGEFGLIHTTSANENSFTDSSIVVGRNYTYQIKSYNSAGPSIDSAVANIIICEEAELVFDNYVYMIDTIATNNDRWWANAIGDIDKNGFSDIVFQNNNANGGYLGWLQANDNGTSWVEDTIALAPPTGGTFASGDLEVGDIDGDGDLDVLGIKHTGEWDNPNSTSEIFWFKNPTWESIYIGTADDFVKELELTDFNNDGLLDLVVSTFESNQFQVYRQDVGDIWTRVLNTNIVNLHEGMDVGDLDGDGDTDIAANGYWIQNPGGDLATNWAVKLIDEKWHNQEGTWQFNGTKIFCQDMNSDGKAEVFIANSENSGYPISWYELTDTLNNSWNENIIATCWSNVHALQVFDVDFDGDFDVLAGENGGQLGQEARLGVFINNGNNQDWMFQEIQSNGGYNALVYDMDENGTKDIVWMDGHTDPFLRVAINKNNVPLSFGDWERHVIDSLKPAKSIFITSNDLDGDSRSDIITGGWWYKNPGNNDGLWIRNSIGGNVNNMAATFDFDGDDDIDILGTTGVGSNPSSDFILAYNDGQGSFIYDDITDGQGDFIQGVAVSRFQNNEIGVAISWHQADQGIQMLNNSLGNWNWSTISSFSQDEDLSMGDIDKDGDDDLLLGTHWLSNEGDSWTDYTLSSAVGLPDRNELVDINRDGRLDAVIGYEAISTQGKVAWYEQPQNPADEWIEHIISVNEIGPMSLDVTDIDFDGDIDIVIGEHNLVNPGSAECIIFENRNNGNSWNKHLVYVGDEHHDGTRFTDIDNDGDMDIISIGWGHSKVLLYENLAIDLPVPLSPTTLNATELSQTVIGLTWTDNSDNEEGFIIERQEDGGGYVLLDSIGVDETSYNDSTVTAGINYNYRVMASNAAGRSTESNIATIIIEIPVTVPNPPTTLNATELSQTVIGLTWTDNSDNEVGFIIERQEDGGGYAELDSIGVDETSYNDSTVTAGINYDYRLKATNVVGSSLESNIASIYILPLPNPPTGLIAQLVADSVVNLSWTDNSLLEAGFRIERQENGAGYVLLDSVAIDETSLADSTVMAGITYEYRVRSFNASGVSAPSNEETIYIDIPLTVPEAPTNLQATILSSTVIGLGWTDNSDNEERFIIERQENGGGYFVLDSVGIDETSYNDSTVIAGINYDYRVIATNSAGQSTPGNVATGYIPTVPLAPASLTSTELNQTTVLLSWTDNSDDEEEFEIERSENGGSFSLLTTIGADTSTYQDMTVGPAMSYAYRVRAINSTGASTYSDTTNITMSGPPSNLVLDLRFSGDAVDWSSYNNDGILNGPQLTTDKDNAAEMAYSFDGANDFIEVPDSPELNVDQITMTGWIYTDSYKDDQRIISKETGTVKPWSAYTLLLSGTGERQLEFRIGIGGERFRLASTTDIPLNQWVHVAGTYDGTNMRLYINGQLNNTLAASGPIQDTPNPIYVGGSQFWPRAFNGKLDEIRVYNDALTDSDIFNSYSTSNARIGNNEVTERATMKQLKTIDVLAYPNPLTLGSGLTIRIPDNITEKELLDLHVIDMQGKILTKIELTSSYLIDNNSSIELSDCFIIQGIYFIQLSSKATGILDTIKIVVR